MNTQSESSSMDDKQLRELISSWWDGQISEKDFEILKSELRANKKSREIYYAYTAVHSEIRNTATAIGYLDSLPKPMRKTIIICRQTMPLLTKV